MSSIPNSDRAFYIAASLLTSIESFNSALTSVMCRCGQLCVINAFIKLCEQISSPSARIIKSFVDAVTQYFQKIEQYEESSNKYDPIDIISAVLVNIHCLVATGTCYRDKESSLKDCRLKCPLHSLFYLGVRETYTCECGKSYGNNWEQNNICQFFNTSGLFEGFIQENSLVLANFPREILGETEYGCSKMFLNAVNRKLKKRLEIAFAETCRSEECKIKSSSIRFDVINAPKVYIIDLIWDDDPNLIGSLRCFFSTIGLQKSFNIIDIYINGSKRNYNINQIIFSRNDIFKIAKLKDPYWEMEGIHNQASWEDVLKEITLHRLYPISVIYIESTSNSQFDLGNFQLLKIEQRAAQCEEFREHFGRPCVSEDIISTGFFKELKKPKALIQQSRPEPQSKNISLSRDIRPQYEHDREKISPNEEKKASAGQIYQSSASKAMIAQEIQVEKSIQRNSLEPKVLDFKPEQDFKTKPIPDNITRGFEQDSHFKNAKINWICSCGEKNMMFYEKCIRCQKIKNENNIEEWLCNNCNKRNKQESDHTCEHCRQLDIERYRKFWETPKNNSNLNYQELKPAEEKIKNEEKFEMWKCPCGTSNRSDYLACPNCSKMKPGVKGWLCKNCLIVNEEYTLICSFKNRLAVNHKILCSICKSYESEKETLNQNFWLCEKCNSAILEGINFCDRCKFRREINKKKTLEIKYGYNKASSETNGDVYNIKKEDIYISAKTECPKCKKITRKYAGKCLECNESTTVAESYRNFKNEEVRNVNKDASLESSEFYERNGAESQKSKGDKSNNYKYDRKDNQHITGSEKSRISGIDINDKKFKCENCSNYNLEYISSCFECRKIKSIHELDEANYPIPLKKCYQCKKTLGSKDLGNFCAICLNKFQAGLNEKNTTPQKDEASWTCNYCEVTMEYYCSLCSKCWRPKEAMSKKLEEENKFSRIKTCSKCNKSLNIIECVCKRVIHVSEITCRYCRKNTEAINVCSFCTALSN